MKLKILILCVALTGGCQKPVAVQPVVEAQTGVESATRWSAKTELFAEYPGLASGELSRFAIHLTRLDNFKAVKQGKVVVRLERAGTAVEEFRAEAPSRPGIFGVDVKPGSTGEYLLSIAFQGEGLEDRHELGVVKVAAKRAPVQPEGTSDSKISFLKEQQWLLDFGVVVVGEKVLRTDLRVPGEVTARSGGEADVDAPLDGRLTTDAVPVIGSGVKEGQVIARLVLSTNFSRDLAGLELSRAEAVTALEYARKDRARAERLVASGAAPTRRLDEAVAVAQTAEARLQAAQQRLAQYEASSNSEGNVSGSKLFVIRAPISGVVQAVKTAPGANVKAGQILFQIVDLDQVYVAAILPEAQFPKMRTLTGAELEVPGLETPRRLERLIAIGRVVDSPSRTFPVTYAVDNRDRRLAINQTVYVRLFSGDPKRVLAVPESAVVEDQGQPVMYVQESGESFGRRVVKLGRREGGLVEVLDGLKPGERVVHRGASLIRLSSMSNAVPAHGHVH